MPESMSSVTKTPLAPGLREAFNLILLAMETESKVIAAEFAQSRGNMPYAEMEVAIASIASKQAAMAEIIRGLLL